MNRSLVLCVALALFCIIPTAQTIHAAIVATGNVEPANPNTWTDSTIGYIGNTASGTLTVNSGSDIYARRGHIGYNSGVTGVVSVNGAGSTWTNGDLFVGRYGSGTLNITGGGTVVSNGFACIGTYSGSTGVVTVAGVGSTLLTYGLRIGNEGEGHVVQTGGTVTVNHYFEMGYGDSTYQGVYDLQGGILNLRYGNGIGQTGRAIMNVSGTGTLNVDSGYVLAIGGAGWNNSPAQGTLTIADQGVVNAYGGVEFGQKASTTGTVKINGGTLNAPSMKVGIDGTATVTQIAGTANISGAVVLASNAGSHGAYYLNGGTLIAHSLTKGSGTATFNFGGGTLQASGDFSTTLPITLTGNGGDANVDTAGYAVTFSGQLSGPGGLNKLGNNTLTLSVANTYAGPTTVSGGMLLVDGSLAPASAVTVQSGGALGGTGTVGNLTVYGVHAPGSSPGIQTIQGNYNMLGQLQMELVGTTVGTTVDTGYDQVLLSGPGSYDANLGGTLALDWTGMSGSSADTQLWILRNDTSGTFSGTFSNYANGALLGKYDGRNWSIWYGAEAATESLAGGNDVLIGAMPISPALALPADYSLPRVMRDSGAIFGSSSITIATAGEVAGDFSLASTGTNALSVTPTSGSVPAGNTDPVPFGFGWTDTSATGAKTGLIALTNLSDPLDPNNHEMSVDGAVLDNRQLTVGAVGTALQPVRAVVNCPRITTIASGSDPLLDDDDHATRVDTVADGMVSLHRQRVTVGYQGTPLATFNGPDQSTELFPGQAFRKAPSSWPPRCSATGKRRRSARRFSRPR